MGRKLFLLGAVFFCSSLVFGIDSICPIDKELNKDTKKKEDLDIPSFLRNQSN